MTLIEMITVLTLMGAMLGIALPMMRVSPQQKVETAARQLIRDLELVRTRALAARKAVRMNFDVAAGTYIGYLDENKDGIFDESATEHAALMSFGLREIGADIRFAVGSAGVLPGDAADAVTFDNDRVHFGPTGVTDPFGTRGTVYLVHRDNSSAVAAVSITGSGSFKLWRHVGGVWE
jgi:Tfp pilus assembly protein FimT